MVNRFSIFLCFLLAGYTISAQTTIAAKVIDTDSKDPIPFLTVKYAEGKGVVTNEEGDFSITINEDIKETDSIQLSYMGYGKKSFAIKGFNLSTIELKEEALELATVFVTDKKLPPEEIIERVKNNLTRNYKGGYTKNKFFLRESYSQYYKQFDFGFKKSSIKELNKELIDSIANSIPKRMAYYNETLGNLYTQNFNSQQKLNIIKGSKLFNKDLNLSFEALNKKLMDIMNKNIKRDSYLKIRSGIIGTKVEVDSIVNDVKEAEKKAKENPHEHFHDQRTKTLRYLLGNLFYEEDSEMNMLHKSHKYEFELLDYAEVNDDLAYVISYRSKNGNGFNGKMYVNTDDFAVLRIDYASSKNIYDKKFNMFGINANHINFEGSMHFSKHDENKYYTLQYLQHRNLDSFKLDRPLAVIEKNKHVKGKRKQNELKLQMLFNLINRSTYDLVIFNSEEVNNDVVNNITENKKVEVKHFSKYNPDFWKGYNIIEPNKAIRSFTAEEQL
ncbi:carboxypeptidase-like regulatory domain-containing protein [Pseudofulvibacter geojedonensis]|uniref:Carboxypeptidase-like regulatory domain-containing protein n=1 Tax=Pseudofulvibacter geojedonensis TaxID=1123758 RepID=A0ABW3HYX8_9FLAO